MASLLAQSIVGFGQEVTSLKSLVDGTVVPNQLRPQDLTDEYWPVMLSAAGSSYLTDAMGSMLPLMFLGGSSSTLSPQLALVKAMQVSWTKGQTIRIGNTDMLATYRLDFDAAGFETGTRVPQSMNLVLVRMDSITTVTAQPGMTKDKFLQVLGLADKPSTMDVKAAQTQTMSNAKQVCLGLMMYASDYDDVLPFEQSTNGVKGLVAPYLKNNDLWETKNPNGGRILYNMNLAGVPSSNIDNPAGTPMLFEEKAWPDGKRVVGYADGHVRLVIADEWTSIEAVALKRKFSRKVSRAVPAPPAAVRVR